jgi:hypothetical protein
MALAARKSERIRSRVARIDATSKPGVLYNICVESFVRFENDAEQADRNRIKRGAGRRQGAAS